MEVKLDSLIEKIKKEGIEEAQQTSEEIVNEAKKKAAAIIEEAHKEKEKIIEEGKKQAEKFRQNAEADIKNAARNTELLLKEKILALFDRVFKRRVASTLNPEFLKDLILEMVTNWARGNNAEIILNGKDKEKLESLLFNGLSKELKDKINLRVSRDVAHGFRIGLKGEDVYYDFSDEAIADVLKSLINPKLKEILNG